MNKQTKYTNVSLGLPSPTSGVVFISESSMMFIAKQQEIQNAPINHNLLYNSTRYTLTGEINRNNNIFRNRAEEIAASKTTQTSRKS